MLSLQQLLLANFGAAHKAFPHLEGGRRLLRLFGHFRLISCTELSLGPFNLAHRLRLVIDRGKAAECHILRPVEASIVFWVLDVRWPVVLVVDLTGDRSLLTLVVLLGLR